MKKYIIRFVIAIIFSMILSYAAINICVSYSDAYCGTDLNQTICLLRHVKNEYGPPESIAIEHVKVLVLSLAATIGVLNCGLVLSNLKKYY